MIPEPLGHFEADAENSGTIAWLEREPSLQDVDKLLLSSKNEIEHFALCNFETHYDTLQPPK